MTNKNSIDVPLSFEHMMSYLFGKKNYHGLVGAVSNKCWKRDLVKINQYIKKSIDINVNSDRLHRQILTQVCDRLDRKIRKAKIIDEMNVAFVES